jgi:GNAT superfamily N-acetyltransferase
MYLKDNCEPNEMKYSISDDMTKEEAVFVRTKLTEFADPFTGPRNYRTFGIVLRSEDGDVAGGLTADVIWTWLRVDVLWISDSLRNKGYGNSLMDAAEKKGIEMGCKFAMLDTFEFEAREFYEARGYSVMSQTDNFPEGHTHFHLSKPLSSIGNA